MSIEAAPGSELYAYTSQIQTGLAPTMTVQILDGPTGVYGPTGDDLVEVPVGSGRYAALLTAPADPGRYLIVFTAGDGRCADEELIVTERAVQLGGRVNLWDPRRTHEGTT
jgi:hypothetical protein